MYVNVTVPLTITPTNINTDSEKHNAVKNNDPAAANKSIKIYSLPLFDVNFKETGEKCFKNIQIYSLFIDEGRKTPHTLICVQCMNRTKMLVCV